MNSGEVWTTLVIVSILGFAVGYAIERNGNQEAIDQIKSEQCSDLGGMFVKNAYQSGKYTSHTKGICFDTKSIIEMK